ncbi:MAG: methyltransferase domain-containing protein [Thermomicrobiales bacterium]
MDWLDLHFEANRSDYEAALRSAGIEQGWHVLDAACGAGNYLPWISELVGSKGSITALDLAPENIAIVKQRCVLEWHLDAAIETSEGSVLDLPYPDQTFDAIWFANTSQYLPDEELTITLAEFRRVLKPDGLLAVKDMDIGMWAIVPGPADAFWKFFAYLIHSEGWNQIKGLSSRAWNMQNWLGHAGFTDIRQQTLPIEWRAPLTEAQRGCLTQMLGDFSSQILQLVASGELRLPDDVRQFWAIAGEPDHPDHPVNSDDCYSRDGQFVATGRAPA